MISFCRFEIERIENWQQKVLWEEKQRPGGTLHIIIQYHSIIYIFSTRDSFLANVTWRFRLKTMQRFLSPLHLCIEPFLVLLGCKRGAKPLNHGHLCKLKSILRYLKINHVRVMSERRILSNDALGWGIGKREANEHRQVVYQVIDLRQVITSHSESTDFTASLPNFFQGNGWDPKAQNGIMQGLPQETQEMAQPFPSQWTTGSHGFSAWMSQSDNASQGQNMAKPKTFTDLQNPSEILIKCSGLPILEVAKASILDLHPQRYHIKLYRSIYSSFWKNWFKQINKWWSCDNGDNTAWFMSSKQPWDQLLGRNHSQAQAQLAAHGTLLLGDPRQSWETSLTWWEKSWKSFHTPFTLVPKGQFDVPCWCLFQLNQADAMYFFQSGCFSPPDGVQRYKTHTA